MTECCQLLSTYFNSEDITLLNNRLKAYYIAHSIACDLKYQTKICLWRQRKRWLIWELLQYKYYTIIFIVSLTLLKDVKVMISMNIDARFIFYFLTQSFKTKQNKKLPHFKMLWSVYCLQVLSSTLMNNFKDWKKKYFIILRKWKTWSSAQH